MKSKNERNIKFIAATLFSWALLNTGAVAAEANSPASAVSVAPIFATVGTVVITQQEFDAAFAETSRKRFYHFKPPAEDIAIFQRQVADTLITNALLLHEAKRRGMKPDAAEIAENLRQQEQRYAKNEQFQQNRAEALAQITRQLQEEYLLGNLEKLVRKVPNPSEKQLREYYAAHQDKFTVPPQLRISVIMLKVDPSSPSTVWQAAHEKGQDLVKRLRAGTDFAGLAREISDDPSAEKGGDMGYLHEGMLDQAAQQTVDKLQPGEVSDPIQLMEGISIFRLTDRQPQRLNSFDEARDRISKVWLSEQSDIAWKTFIAKLKKTTPIHVDESHYLPLPAVAETEGSSVPATKQNNN